MDAFSYLMGWISGTLAAAVAVGLALWISRTSGEAGTRALERVWPYAVDLARGEYEAKLRAQKKDSA